MTVFQVHPDIGAYLAAEAVAGATLSAAESEARQAYHPYSRELRHAMHKARADHQDALRLAELKLTRSKDPAIAWLMKNTFRAYRSETLIVLRCWPMTRDELDLLALRGGWCDAYEHVVGLAVSDGVMPD